METRTTCLTRSWKKSERSSNRGSVAVAPWVSWWHRVPSRNPTRIDALALSAAIPTVSCHGNRVVCVVSYNGTFSNNMCVYVTWQKKPKKKPTKKRVVCVLIDIYLYIDFNMFFILLLGLIVHSLCRLSIVRNLD